MGLIVKPPSWGKCTTNITGTPPAALSGVFGTAVVAGSSNIDGANAPVLTNLSHDVEMLVIVPRNFAVTGGNGSCALDILVDPTGSTNFTVPLINDLLVGQVQLSVAPPMKYYFPIWLPAGCSIGARAKTAHTANITGDLLVYAMGDNANPGSWWCGQTVTSIGTSSTLSHGVNHTPGNSGVYSTWTNFGDVTPAPTGAVQFIAQGTNTDTTQAAAGYYFEFGVGGTRIGPNLVKLTTVAETGGQFPGGPVFCSCSSGMQFQVRATCSSNAEILDVAAYVVS